MQKLWRFEVLRWDIFRSSNLVLFHVFCLCTVLPIYIEKAEERKLCYLQITKDPSIHPLLECRIRFHSCILRVKACRRRNKCDFVPCFIALSNWIERICRNAFIILNTLDLEEDYSHSKSNRIPSANSTMQAITHNAIQQSSTCHSPLD
jgi:hypothetical protein